MDPRSPFARGAIALALTLHAGALARAEEPCAAGTPCAAAQPATSAGQRPATAAPTTSGTATAPATAPADASAAAPASASGIATAPTTTAAPADAPAAGTDAVELPEQVVRIPAAEATRDPTGAVTVVSAERFAGEAKQVAELVATAPGVAVSEYGGLGQYATASIRGSTADGVLVLLDGLPLNTAFGGGVNLASIPRQWIDRIEVMRGAEGAHYGAGALGGAVNVVTLPARAGAWNLETGGGSFETWTASGDAAVDAGRFTVLAGASADGTSGRFPFVYDSTPSLPGGDTTMTRTHNGAARGSGLVKLGGPLGDGRLDALAQVSGGHRDVPPVPGQAGSDWQDDGRAVAQARLAFPGPSPELSFAARGQLRVDRLDVRTGSRVDHQRGGAAGAGLEAALGHPGGTLGGGVSAEGETLDADGLASARQRATLAAWVEDDLATRSGTFRLAPALRFEQVGPFAGWSAKLGARVRLGGGVELRASGGRTFRAPSFAELYLQQAAVRPNPDLRPEDGLAGDAGLAWSGAAGMASLNGFATLYRDLILYDRASLNTWAPRNAGRALVTGLEAEAASAPARALAGLALSGSYTLLVSENLRDAPDSVGKWLPHRARHRLYARAAATPGPVALHLDAQYVGLQYTNSQNTNSVPAALAWNAGASVRLTTRPRLVLALEVRNALDDRTLQDNLGNPLPGRTVLVTLRASDRTTTE